MALEVIDSRPSQLVEAGERPGHVLKRTPSSFLWQTVLSLSRFNQLAAGICSKLASLLEMQVLATNNHGIIVAASEPALVGQSVGALQPSPASILIPLNLDGETGEVLLYRTTAASDIAPELAHRIARMVIEQAMLVDQFPERQILKDKFIYGLLHGHISDITTIEYTVTKSI